MSVRISTGLIRAAGYADKLRKVLIAATKVKGVPVDEAVRVAAYINQHLFKVLRENQVEKGDVVRIMFNVDILDKKIGIVWDSLKIEVYKPAEHIVAKEVGVEVPKEMPEVTEEEVREAIREAEATPPEEIPAVPEEKPSEIAPSARPAKKGFFSRLVEKLKRIFGGK